MTAQTSAILPNANAIDRALTLIRSGDDSAIKEAAKIICMEQTLNGSRREIMRLARQHPLLGEEIKRIEASMPYKSLTSSITRQERTMHDAVTVPSIAALRELDFGKKVAICGSELFIRHDYSGEYSGAAGFVGDMADVEHSVKVSPYSVVHENARAVGHATILGSTELCGNAVITDDAVVNAGQIGGSAWIGGYTRILGEDISLYAGRLVTNLIFRSKDEINMFLKLQRRLESECGIGSIGIEGILR